MYVGCWILNNNNNNLYTHTPTKYTPTHTPTYGPHTQPHTHTYIPHSKKIYLHTCSRYNICYPSKSFIFDIILSINYVKLTHKRHLWGDLFGINHPSYTYIYYMRSTNNTKHTSMHPYTFTHPCIHTRPPTHPYIVYIHPYFFILYT